MFDRYIVCGGVRDKSVEVAWGVNGSPEDIRGGRKSLACDGRRVGPENP